MDKNLQSALSVLYVYTADQNIRPDSNRRPPTERKEQQHRKMKHGFEDQGSSGSYGFLSCKSGIDRTDRFRFLRFIAMC